MTPASPRPQPSSPADLVLAVLVDLRPEHAAWPPPEWLRIVFRADGEELDLAAASARKDPTEACRWLAAIVADEALARETAVGDGYAPTNAAAVLGELGQSATVTEEAIDALVVALGRATTNDAIFDTGVRTLTDMGAPALEIVLAAHATAEPGSDGWMGLAEVLADLGVRDPRVRAALAVVLDVDEAFGAGLIGSYGDRALLPLIQARWNALDPWHPGASAAGAGWRGVELADALRQLSGPLGEADEQKLARCVELRRRDTFHREDDDPEFLADDLREILEDAGGFAPTLDPLGAHAYGGFPPTTALDEAMDLERIDDTPTPPLGRREVPGRNDPCWCGSGKKYKKCHADADATGPGAKGDAPRA